MLNKQNIWFMTLFSLILVLGVYYVTMPSSVLEKVNIKTNLENAEVKEVVEESSLVALRVNKEEQRKEKIDSLESALVSDNLTVEEKNNTFELLRNINEIQGREESFEKKLKKQFGMDCYTKIENNNISVICISKEHDKVLANNIMRTLQGEFSTPMNITVKFQKN